MGVVIRDDCNFRIEEVDRAASKKEGGIIYTCRYTTLLYQLSFPCCRFPAVQQNASSSLTTTAIDVATLFHINISHDPTTWLASCIRHGDSDRYHRHRGHVPGCRAYRVY